MYMSRLGLLERLFPTAVFVHLVRDGRDAARSFLEMPPGLVTESWAHPRDIAGPIAFLCSDLARHITGEILNVNGGSVLVG